MGQKDISEKLLEDYNDVFADIANVLLFQGKPIVKEKDLHETNVKSQYKADDRKLHEQERDVLKSWQNTNIRLALMGYENQTVYDRYMPVRIIGYDGVSYRSQLLEDKNVQNICPVVTLVLYFGSTPWGKVKSLYDCMEVPEELKPFVNDYKINVFDISFLSQEQIDMFQSDFRYIVEYYVQKRTKHDFMPSRNTVDHVDELMKMFTVLTGDNRYEETLLELKEKGGQIGMCEVLDKIEARGEAKGETRGKILAYSECGLSVEEIAQKVHVPVEEIKQILKTVTK